MGRVAKTIVNDGGGESKVEGELIEIILHPCYTRYTRKQIGDMFMAIAAHETQPYLTPQAYLAQEREAETKSEYYAGQVYAMSGANEAHNLIVWNVGGELRSLLKKRPCKGYPSDMRVKVSPTGLYTYPDVTVVCGEAQFDDGHKDTLLNPTVIIEVLSESTEAYDRGKKFAHYRTLDSLAEYLLVAQDSVAIDRYVRQSDGGWLLTAYRGLAAVAMIEAIDCELPLAEVYDKVEGLDDEDWGQTLSVLKEDAGSYSAQLI